MKKITLLILAFLSFIDYGYSQIVINENFESSGSLPVGWTGVGGFFGTTTAPCQGIRSFRVNVYDTNPTGSLTSPNYPAASNGTNTTVSFVWKGTDYFGAPVGFTFNAQYSTDDGATWTSFGSPIVGTAVTSCATFSATIPAASLPSGSAFKFRVDGVWNSGDCYFWIDNISINQVVSSPPVCAANPVSTPNVTCGNFAVPLAWDTVTGIIGYKLRIGTTSGGTDVLNDINVGTAITYNFTNPIANTTYYWRVTPFNSAGDAVSCSNNSFITATNGCYCVPAPTSVDGIGITNVTIGTINNTTVAEAGNYGDYSAQITDVQQGLSTPVAITFQTGYTYVTKIWVDWNNDFDFDDVGEEVYSATSTNASPTTLSGAFVIPAAASLGNHRMRIGSADTGPPTPCYTGAYGSYEDYTLNVVAPTCTPPVSTTSVIHNCGTNQFTVAVNVTSLGSGSPVLTDGTTNIPVTAVGVVNFGPIAYGTPVTLTLQHGSASVCNVPLGTFSYATCPPVNDDCTNAVTIAAGVDFTSSSVLATNSGSTSSSTLPLPVTCGGFSGGDVWFKLLVPTGITSMTFETNEETASPLVDTVVTAYTSSDNTCSGTLTQIGCDDDGGTASFSLFSVTGLTPGNTIFLRAYEYSNDVFGSFRIAAYDPSLSASKFDLNSFTAYPNPVNDILNLSYTQDISKVSVHNLLGQEVITKSVNATQSQIDMSNLSNGTYLVKVTSGGATKTLKVLKQ